MSSENSDPELSISSPEFVPFVPVITEGLIDFRIKQHFLALKKARKAIREQIRIDRVFKRKRIRL